MESFSFTLTEQDVSAMYALVDRVMKRNAAAVRVLLMHDRSISKEDIREELIQALLKLIAKRGNQVPTWAIAQDPLYDALISYSRMIQGKSRTPQFGMRLISIEAKPADTSESGDIDTCETNEEQLSDPQEIPVETLALLRTVFRDTYEKNAKALDREIYQKIVVDGLTQQETADLLGVTQPEISMRRKHMQSVLKDLWHDEE